jgi:hypothetical protein
MARFRYRLREDDDSSNTLLYIAAGAVVGLVAGLFVAQRFGGVSAVASRVRERVRRRPRDEELEQGAERAVEDEDEIEDVPDEELEERVLEAFINDPILCERAIDIGAIGEGTVELSGWVHNESEVKHATTVAGGVPAVETVVNRLEVRDEVDELNETRRRRENGDPALTESRWEGMSVGTGRRRQGNSGELDRHADPKPELEERWLRTDEAVRDAADDIEGLGTSTRRGARRANVRGDRTGGSPVSPTGVPKADHVAEPLEARDADRAD